MDVSFVAIDMNMSCVVVKMNTVVAAVVKDANDGENM